MGGFPIWIRLPEVLDQVAHLQVSLRGFMFRLLVLQFCLRMMLFRKLNLSPLLISIVATLVGETELEVSF